MPTLQYTLQVRLPLALIAAASLLTYAGVAGATGWPPFAFNDSATVKRGATVSVLDSGQTSVLANDFDFEGDVLTAVLTRGPRFGDVTLNEDGTFTYRHSGSFEDGDNFLYRAFDGQRFSREAAVVITVTPGEPIPPQIVDQRDVSVQEDGSREIRLGDLVVVDPDNRYPQDHTLEVNDGANYTRDGATIFPAENFNGDLSVPVRVFDGTDFSNLFNLRVVVTPRNDPPFVVSPIPDQEIIEGDLFQLAVAGHFDDIDPADSLRFSASGLPSSGSITLDANSGLLRGTPIRTDARDNPYSVRITATDLAGASVSLTFDLTIFANNRADLAVSSRVQRNPTLVGETTSWNIDIENRGPAELEEGELFSFWTTSGPSISLTAPAGCAVSSNNSSTPSLRCSLAELPAGVSTTFVVQGTQSGDGDNTVISEVIADDPVMDNNTALVSAQVALAFSEGPTQELNRPGADLAAADFNSDGYVDLVISGDETVIYLNGGDRTVQTPGTTIGVGGSLLTSLDWDGDGLQDVAVAGPSGRDARIYLGDGNGAFGDSVRLSTGVRGTTTALATADFYGNGRSELVLTGTFGAVLARNRDSGKPRVDEITDDATLDVAVTDFNQDTFPDLVTVRRSDRSVRLLRNRQDGRFASSGSLREGSVARVTAADLDNDGDSDLLLAIDGDDLTPPYTKLMRRQSGGNYVVANTLGASVASDLLTGDINADGKTDIVTVTEAGVHQLYTADTGIQFELNAEQIVSPGMERGIIVDFNADNSFDLVLVGLAADSVELHANNGIGRLGLGDRTPPELTLIGPARIAIPAGADYVDGGATAIDDIDGDITDQITVTGSVNAAVVGTYVLTYSVTDRSANVSQVSRTVDVGVNQGTGGSGGGVLSLLSLLALGLLAAIAGHSGGTTRRRSGR